MGRNPSREQQALLAHTGRQRVVIDGVEYVAQSQELPPVSTIDGYWRDVIVYQDGTTELRDWQHNLVVNVFANLVCLLMVGNGAGTGSYPGYFGIQQMEVGQGLAAWDSSLPPPTLTDTALVTPLARLACTSNFVDGSGNVTTTITNSQLVTCTFNVGQANGSLREWGLFGGNATATLGSGIMVDHVTTPILTKPVGVNDFSLTRLVTLIY